MNKNDLKVYTAAFTAGGLGLLVLAGVALFNIALIYIVVRTAWCLYSGCALMPF